ncbi:MAG: hypothetical protein C5S48_07665 [Candidatus Methanogaster sp.]|nr:MAG: hypothetical protein C5S48_07665 [ANME-2 cluster archaeon]
MFFSKMSVAQTIKSLREMSHLGLGNEPSQSEMHKLISKVEKRFLDSDSYELEYRLGIALRNYTAWFVRGDERKLYLQEAVQHLEKAYALSKEVISEELTATDKHTLGSLDRNTIACEVGFILIDEAIIRDLEKGISYLGTIFNNTTNYYPQFCSYAEAFYMLGDYLKSAEVALELHRRAEKSFEWKGSVPPAPIGIVAKAYRAKPKEHKKNGEIRQAISLFQKLDDMNMATDNDQKLLEKLRVSGKKQ